MEKDNHIQVDLDLLDKDKEALSQSPDQPKTQVKRETEYNWKKIIITIICVVFFIGLLASDDGSSTSTSSPPTCYSNTNSNSYNSGNQLVANGEFMCTSYHNRKATELEPTDEYTIELERSRLDRKATELESLESIISNSTASEYSSQCEIDQHNHMIDN